jgi:hypothetical protein
MDKTKAVNIFRSMCMMLAIMVTLILLALGVEAFVGLSKGAQIGVGLVITLIVGTYTIYSIAYGSLSFHADDGDDDFEDNGRYN